MLLVKCFAVALAVWVALTVPVAAREIVLEFPSWQATEPGTMDFWKALIGEFERLHPGVRIDFYPVPFDVYVRTMLTRFAGGNPPDIVHLPARDLWVFAEWLEPMDEELGDLIEKWIPLQRWCIDDAGNTIAFLVLGFGFVMVYNELLLKEAGIEHVPTTWDALLEAAVRITDKDKGIWGYAIDTAGGTHTFDYLIAVVSIGLTGKNILSDDGEFREDVFRQTAEYIRALVDSGASPRGMSRLVCRELVVEGKAGFYIDGPWILAYLDMAKPELRPHLKLALVPAAKEMGVAGGVSNSLSVPKGLDSQKRALVYDFIRLLATPEWQRKYALIAGLPAPGGPGMFAPGELEELRPELAVSFEAAALAVDFIPLCVKKVFPEYRRAITEPMMDYVLRGADLDLVVERARSNVAALLKKD